MQPYLFSTQCACAVLYCHLPHFPHYLIKATIFGKVIEHKMCVLIFPKRDIIMNVHVFTLSTCYSQKILMEVGFSLQVSK